MAAANVVVGFCWAAFMATANVGGDVFQRGWGLFEYALLFPLPGDRQAEGWRKPDSATPK